MKPKSQIAVLETGHILEGYPAAGDRILEEIAKRLPPKYLFHILVPKIGAKHWLKSGFSIEYSLLPPTPFDNKTNPFLIFLTYLIRMWQVFWKLRTLTSINIIYSSTHILPDVLPAYVIKKKRPNAIWIAKIHHMVSPPSNRPGNLLVNVASYIMQKITLFCLKDAGNLILVNNSRLRSGLIRMNFPKRKIRILGDGIEFSKISEFKPSKKTNFDAVFLGRLHPTKGIFDTIPIWNQVVKQFPQAKLAIIGEGSIKIKRRLKSEITKANLFPNIKVLGYLPYSDVYTIMKQAKVFLFLDYEAGWGLAVAEAMACRLPIVGYDIGVLGNVFTKGYLTVPLYNKNLFAQKIIFLLKNEKARKKLSTEAFLQARQLDWQKTTQKFSQILNETLTKQTKIIHNQ